MDPIVRCTPSRVTECGRIHAECCHPDNSNTAAAILFVRLGNDRLDAFAAKRYDDTRLSEHVVGRVAAIV